MSVYVPVSVSESVYESVFGSVTVSAVACMFATVSLASIVHVCDQVLVRVPDHIR